MVETHWTLKRSYYNYHRSKIRTTSVNLYVVFTVGTYNSYFFHFFCINLPLMGNDALVAVTWVGFTKKSKLLDKSMSKAVNFIGCYPVTIEPIFV